ncbi:MAG: tetratricopeptide repeat protein, partial [Parasphingopyxis sp.]
DARSAATGETAMNTADAYVGYGDYEPAIALYRTALEKGGVDAGTVNLRLGRALYEAGRMDGAREAFAAVSGDRAGLARFWQIWIDQQSGGGAAAAEPAAETEAETEAEADAETTAE